MKSQITAIPLIPIRQPLFQSPNVKVTGDLDDFEGTSRSKGIVKPMVSAEIIIGSGYWGIQVGGEGLGTGIGAFKITYSTATAMGGSKSKKCGCTGGE